MEYEALLDKRLQAADQQCAELDQARVKGEAEKAKLEEQLADKEQENHELSMIIEEAVEEAEGWKQDVLFLRDKLKTAEQSAEKTDDMARYLEREKAAQELVERNENARAALRQRVAAAEEVAEARETPSFSVRETMKRRDRVAWEEKSLARVDCANVEHVVRMAEVGAARGSTRTVAAEGVSNRDEEIALLSKRLEAAEQQSTKLTQARIEWESERMVLEQKVENFQRALTELSTAVKEAVGNIEDSKRDVLLLKEKLATVEQSVTATDDIVRLRESMEHAQDLVRKMEREVLALQQRLGEKQAVSGDSAKRTAHTEVTAVSCERETMELRNRVTLHEDSLAKVKRTSIELTAKLAQMTESMDNFQTAAEKRASLCEAEVKMAVERLEAAEQHQPAFNLVKADWASEEATCDKRIAGVKNEYEVLAKTAHKVIWAAENCERSVRRLREQLVAAERDAPAHGKKIIGPHRQGGEAEDKLAKMSACAETAAETADFWKAEAQHLRDRQNNMEQSMEAARNINSLSEVRMKEMRDDVARFKAEAEERMDSKDQEIALLTTILTEMEDTKSQVGLTTMESHVPQKQGTRADILRNLEQKPAWREGLIENEEPHESEATTAVRGNRSAEREAASHHVHPTVVLDEVARKAIERRARVGRMARELRVHRPALREVAPNLDVGGGKFSSQMPTQTRRPGDEELTSVPYVPTTYKRWPFRPGNPCLAADSRENLRVGPEATRETVEVPATQIRGERKRVDVRLDST